MKAELKIRIARFWFLYACVGAAVNVAWCAAILLGHPWFPENAKLATAIFSSWMILLLATFWRSYKPKSWEPVLKVTPWAIRVARIGLALIAAQLVGSYIMGWLTRMGSPERDTLVFFAVASFFLLGSAYSSAHWALRPENVLSPKIVFIAQSGLSFPFLYFFSRNYRESFRSTKSGL